MQTQATIQQTIPTEDKKALVIDRKTGDIISRRKSLKSARRYADKLDLHHGAVRYIVRLED